MEKLAFKRKILENARKRQEEIIYDFRTRLTDIRQSEMIVNEDQYDHDQQSIDEANKEMISALSDQLDFALDEKFVLDKMFVPELALDYVTIGSVVETDKAIFYPSVSIERFDVEGKEVIGISRSAPLYMVMEGKRKGDEFSYNDVHYSIKDIY